MLIIYVTISLSWFQLVSEGFFFIKLRIRSFWMGKNMSHIALEKKRLQTVSNFIQIG